MEIIEWDCERLLGAIVSALPGPLVAKHLGSSSFDTALQTAFEQHLLPEWFQEYLEFNPRYGVCSNLRRLIGLGVRDLMIRIEIPDFQYWPTAKRIEIGDLMEGLNIDPADFDRWIARLRELLEACP